MHRFTDPGPFKTPTRIPNVRIENSPELFAGRCSGGRCFKDATKILVRDLDGHEIRSPYCEDCVAVLERAYSKATETASPASP